MAFQGNFKQSMSARTCKCMCNPNYVTLSALPHCTPGTFARLQLVWRMTSTSSSSCFHVRHEFSEVSLVSHTRGMLWHNFWVFWSFGRLTCVAVYQQSCLDHKQVSKRPVLMLLLHLQVILKLLHNLRCAESCFLTKLNPFHHYRK